MRNENKEGPSRRRIEIGLLVEQRAYQWMDLEPESCMAFSAKPGFPAAFLPMSTISFESLNATSLNKAEENLVQGVDNG
jgi:hypothetical protein